MFDLEARMKEYEGAESARRLMPLLPIMIRLDGRCFHSFTRHMRRPFDGRFCDAMILTMEYLARESNARCGYTQSDEITLCLYSDRYQSQVFFDGRTQKLCSVLASMASVHFGQAIKRQDFVPGALPETPPLFDCRAWNVPNVEEAANCFLWRELDATRNSVEMAAQSIFSPAACFKKPCSELQEMLFSRGINWNDYSSHEKKGTYYQRYTATRPFSADELERLPEKHQARSNPALTVTRSDYRRLDDMPPFARVANRAAVIVDGAEWRAVSASADLDLMA